MLTTKSHLLLDVLDSLDSAAKPATTDVQVFFKEYLHAHLQCSLQLKPHTFRHLPAIKQKYCVACSLSFLLFSDHLVEDCFVSKHMLFFVLLADMHWVDTLNSSVIKLFSSKLNRWKL